MYFAIGGHARASHLAPAEISYGAVLPCTIQQTQHAHSSGIEIESEVGLKYSVHPRFSVAVFRIVLPLV
jgi:hypothetical protein